MSVLIPHPATEVAPGAMHAPCRLTFDQQRDLVTA